MAKKSIEAMLANPNEDDRLEIAQIAKNVFHGASGVLLHALVNAIIEAEETKGDEDLTQSRAEYRLGRISGAKLVIRKLEQCIFDGDNILATRDQATEHKDVEKQEVPVYKGSMAGAV